jgi:hypothetical protein
MPWRTLEDQDTWQRDIWERESADDSPTIHRSWNLVNSKLRSAGTFGAVLRSCALTSVRQRGMEVGGKPAT